MNFLDFGFPAPVVSGTPFRLIDVSFQPGGSTTHQRTWTEELQLQGVVGDGKFNYVVGGYLEFSEPKDFNAGRTAIFTDCDSPNTLDCDFSAIPLAGNVTDASNRFDFENHGLFAQGTYAFNERWALTTGVRYTFDTIEAYDQSVRHAPLPFQPDGPVIATCSDVFRFPGVIGTDPSTCGKTIKQKSREPTWLVNLDYKPNADTLLYAKYARGYRQGGINFTNPGLETWEPEEVDSYEVGAKLSFSGAVPGYLNIAAFYNDYTNQQVFAQTVTDRTRFPGIAGGAAIVNAGSSEIYGVEIDASVLLFDRLRVSGGYAYLDTEIKEIDTSGISLEGTPYIGLFPQSETGLPLNLVPKNKLTLTASYLLPMQEEMGELSIAATYTFTDKQLVDANSPKPYDYLPSRELINLNLDWTRIGGSALDLRLFATNVTNKEYPVAQGGGYTSFGIVDHLYGEPRMFGARLRYNFGN